MSEIPETPYEDVPPNFQVRPGVDRSSAAATAQLQTDAEDRRRKQKLAGNLVLTDTNHVKRTYLPALAQALPAWVTARLINGDPNPPAPPIADTTTPPGDLYPWA